MKSKILKIMLGLILFSALFITVSSAATSVKENVNDYTSGAYIIGSTRFDEGTIVTADKAANAGLDEAKRLIEAGKTNEILDLTMKTYYYDVDLEEWYEIGEETRPLTQEEARKLEENLNIFFVNNKEKTLEFNYSANADDINVLTNGVTFDGTKFKVPATKIFFEFTKNNVNITVLTKTNTEGKEEVIEYGSYYIPFIVSYYDKIGGTKLGDNYTTEDNKIITKGLFDYEKMAEELTYVYEDGTEVNFNNPITESINIYQKWIAVGELACENGVFANKTLTYNGNVLLNSDNKNELTVKVYAPKDYDTSATTIEGLTEQFDDVKVLDSKLGAYYVELPVVFASKTDKKDINITWKPGVTSTLKVQLGENAKFEYLVKFNGYSGFVKYKTEKVIEGNKIVGPATNPTKSNHEFIGWTLTENAKDLFDSAISGNIDLYPVYRQLPIYEVSNVKNLKLGEEREFKIYIKPGDYTGKTITITGDITKTLKKNDVITPIEYTENNYFEAWNGTEWVRFENYSITLNEDYTKNEIKIRQKLSENFNSKDKYYIYYTAKEADRVLYCMMGGQKTVLAEQDIVAIASGNYLQVSDMTNVLNLYSNIVLQKDFTITSSMSQSLDNKTVELDLNGKTLTGDFTKAKNMIILQSNNSNLVIKNGTIKTKGNTMAAIALGSEKREYNSSITLAQDAKIVVENAGGGGVSIFGKGTKFILNGEIELQSTGYAISGNGSTLDQNTTVDINSGAKITANNAIALYLPQKGTVNILDGSTITANTVAVIKSGTLNIKGGTLTATGEKVESSTLTASENGANLTGDVVYSEINSGYAGNISINITGGTLTANNGNIIREYNPTVATETKLASATVTGNYTTKTLLDNNVTVYTATSEADFEADGAKYSVNNFIDVATNSANVKLLKDITIKERLNLAKNITLDLGGKTITIDGERDENNTLVGRNNRIDAKGTNNTVTIKNGSIVSNGDYALQAQNGANLIIEADVEITTGIYGLTIWDKASVDFKGKLTVTGEDGYGISGNGNDLTQNTTINIISGSISVPQGVAIYLPQNGTTNIKGGRISGKTVIGILSGTLNIEDGTLTANGENVENENLPIISDGFKSTGDAIFVELNDSYFGNVKVKCTRAAIISSNALLREYSVNGKHAIIEGLREDGGNGDNIKIYK